MNNLEACPGSGTPGAGKDYLGFAPCPVCGAKFAILSAVNTTPRTIPGHARRNEPSAIYYPRTADYLNDPHLSACAKMGLTEEQTIDVLAERCRELHARVMRLMEAQPPAPIVIERGSWSQR